MLKGLMLTPPILGRISIGQVVEKNGKRLPQKDDQFTLTSQLQTGDGWLKHPLDEQLRQQHPEKKLREIPVQLLFADPELNLRSEYSLFERDTGRPFCVGNGETCQHRTPEGIQSFPCPSPEGCDFGGGYCKPYGRLNVVVEGGNHSEGHDPLGSFIFRTTGFNSIRTLSSRLQYFAAISGKRLACLPLALKLRGKSTRQSYGRPIYYVDLTLRNDLSLEETLGIAQAIDEQRQAMGYDQAALDRVARKGYQLGAFEDSAEDGQEIVEEFYPETTNNKAAQPPTSIPVPSNTTQTPYKNSRLNHAIKTQLQAQSS